MLQELNEFLEKNWDGRSPLLLGYSGGPDSKALLYALLDSGCRAALHIAHVDHGWRQESKAEAHALASEAESLGMPFHTVRITAKGEAASRDARLSFFRSLFGKIPFQALLMAHHAGDVAETALKRILEGAHLPNLAGMDPVSRLEGMTLWRPLLPIYRTEIEAFLREKNLQALIDPTNFDPAYLRARMRVEILPFLAKSFGKEISDNLLFHASRSRELKNYLDERVESRIAARGPWGLRGLLDDLKRIEARHLLLKWSREEDALMPRSLIEQVLDAAALRQPNRKISSRIFVDRGSVYILPHVFPRCGEEVLSLAPGVWEWGNWKVEVEELAGNQSAGSDWKDVWTGCFTALAPQGRLTTPIAGNAPRDLWNARRVPAFLRYKVPVVEAVDGRIKEFLSGKILPEMRFSFKLRFSTRSDPAL